jgi:hypothetical protein
MRNGKEVVVLVILIFVVLVSAAKAEVDTMALELNNESEISIFGQAVTVDESRIFTIIDRNRSIDSFVEVGVDTTSSSLNHPDGYGFVMKLTALF